MFLQAGRKYVAHIYSDDPKVNTRTQVRIDRVKVGASTVLKISVTAKGGQAINPRGELYTDANIGERLAVRNLLDDLRGGGQITGGPSNFSAKDRQAFANQLDRWLAKKKD